MDEFSVEQFCSIFSQKNDINQAAVDTDFLALIDLTSFHSNEIINDFSNHSSNHKSPGSDYSVNDYIKKLCHITPAKQNIFETYDTKTIILKYVYPVLFILGILGNILLIFLMIRIKRYLSQKQCFPFCLIMLSISDLNVLVFNCLREYLEDFHGFKIKSSNLQMCKLIFFMSYLFSSLSAYLHVCIAADRWQDIKNKNEPFVSRSIKNKIFISFVFFICMAFSITLSWLATISDSLVMSQVSAIGVDIIKECEVPNLLMIDSIFNCLIPFSLTLFFICLASINIKWNKDKRLNDFKEIKIRSLSQYKMDSFIKRSKTNTNLENGESLIVSTEANRLNRRTSEKNSKMLFSLVITFLLMSLPKTVVFLIV